MSPLYHRLYWLKVLRVTHLLSESII